MPLTCKATKSIAINFILITVLTVVLFSCKNSVTPSKSHTSIPKKNSSPNAKVSKVISTARSYLGTDYKFGGCTKNGMDCSGLMLCSFRAVDMELPRTSKEQGKLGTPIKLNEAKEGDMVFFTDKKGGSTITHVGLITKVQDAHNNITFIHASTKLGVVEENIFASYYLPFFVKAVRVL